MNISLDTTEAIMGRYDWLRGSRGSLNVTALKQVYLRLSPEQKSELYDILNVSGHQQLYDMYIYPYEQDLMRLVWYERSKFLLVYVPPVLLFIGTLGNLLSFMVLMRKGMRQVSAYNYLAVLGITDTLVLYVGLLRLWIGQLTGYDLRDESNVACKLINVIGYTVSDYSVWLLIAVTIERYIVTVHALRASSVCTRARARRVIVAILVVFLIINSHFLFTTKIHYHTEDNTPVCYGDDLVMQIWTWVDIVIYSILPFIVIIVLNAKIIRQVARSLRKRTDLVQAHFSNSRRTGGGTLRCITVKPTRLGSGHLSEFSAKITVMLLVISFVFLLTTLPMTITMIVAAILTSRETATIETAAKFKFARTVTELLMYTNHSINFFLYLIAGNKFRQQLSVLFCRNRGAHAALRVTGSVYSEAEKTQLTQLTELNGKWKNSIANDVPNDL